MDSDFDAKTFRNKLTRSDNYNRKGFCHKEETLKLMNREYTRSNLQIGEIVDNLSVTLKQFHNLFVIKRRLQWKKLLVRLRMLSADLNKPDLWDDPNHAGKIRREHGWLTGKMKGVITFERELLEHIDILKLDR